MNPINSTHKCDDCKPAAHTPTPWKVGAMLKNRNVIYGSGCQITEVNTSAPEAGENEANAAFIVKAVNCHEELVETLKGMSKAFKTLSEKYEPDNTDAEWLAHAHDAISKAEGK